MTNKEKAQEIFNAHYMILFDSESDKGEEILVSLLAKKCAIITVNELLKVLHGDLYSRTLTGSIMYYNSVLSELEKM